ncbi:outer membrane protein [Sinisalibacter lacisalsi]|uniref:Outer membrane protein n=1 Tax=Sinisalibacter lacisalsi TaxID=1526570 RepID=A0ABQ1QLK7_9RHOB|nr:outer membrane beta-barrel protein [Sinisalibacter lacisalsi]GGD30278.1 outer membrane protein [Sinisalibacter lacisalsi]
MRTYLSPLLAAGLCLGMTGIANAQDFDGAYGGAYGRINPNGTFNNDASVGAFAGYNMDVGNGMIMGVEGELDYDFNSEWGAPGDDDLTASANLRAGVDAGAALVYGKAGVGYSTAGTAAWNVGGGADVPIADDYFMRGEVERADPFAAGLPTRYNVKAGLGLRF